MINVLTKNIKTNAGLSYVESDQNVINTEIKLEWFPKENSVVEVFKYSDKNALQMFLKSNV